MLPRLYCRAYRLCVVPCIGTDAVAAVRELRSVEREGIRGLSYRSHVHTIHLKLHASDACSRHIRAEGGGSRQSSPASGVMIVMVGEVLVGVVALAVAEYPLRFPAHPSPARDTCSSSPPSTRCCCSWPGRRPDFRKARAPRARAALHPIPRHPHVVGRCRPRQVDLRARNRCRRQIRRHPRRLRVPATPSAARKATICITHPAAR